MTWVHHRGSVLDCNIPKLTLFMFCRVITLQILTIMLRYLVRFRKRFLEQIKQNMSTTYLVDQIWYGEIIITTIHWFISTPHPFPSFKLTQFVWGTSIPTVHGTVVVWYCHFKRSQHCIYMHIDPIFIWYSSSWNEATERLTEHLVNYDVPCKASQCFTMTKDRCRRHSERCGHIQQMNYILLFGYINIDPIFERNHPQYKT